MLEIYNKVSFKETFAARAKRGSKSKILETGEQWIIKMDLPGEDLNAWEMQVYLHLQKSGLTLAPKFDEQESSDFQLFIKKINNGATLRDYLDSYLEGEIPTEVMIDIFSATGKLLNNFWDAGYTHRDLHLRNIVIGCNKRGTEWIPYIIDFSSSTHKSQVKEWAYDNALILSELENQEDDLKNLLEGEGGVWSVTKNAPPDLEKVVRSMIDEIDVL